MSAALSIGIALALAHAALTAYVVRLIRRGGEADWPMYWLLLVLVDLPYSLVAYAVAKVRVMSKSPRRTVAWLHAPANDLDNFVLPFFILGVGGTVWWFLLPQVIAHVIA